MKKEVNPGVTIAALLVVVALVGFMAWRFFGPEPPPQDTPEARARAQQLADSFRQAARASGGGNAAQPPAPTVGTK